jgi:hypothetical protein
MCRPEDPGVFDGLCFCITGQIPDISTENLHMLLQLGGAEVISLDQARARSRSQTAHRTIIIADSLSAAVSVACV